MRVEVCKAVQRGLPNARHELQEQRLLLVREGRDHIPECILVLLVLLRVLHLRVGSQVLQIEGVGSCRKAAIEKDFYASLHASNATASNREKSVVTSTSRMPVWIHSVACRMLSHR